MVNGLEKEKAVLVVEKEQALEKQNGLFFRGNYYYYCFRKLGE